MSDDALSFREWFEKWQQDHASDELKPTQYEMMLDAWIAGKKNDAPQSPPAPKR